MEEILDAIEKAMQEAGVSEYCVIVVDRAEVKEMPLHTEN